MPPNSVAKNSIVIGGLTFLGYMAGGKLGSMLGAVIGTVVCSLFNVNEPMVQQGQLQHMPYPRIYDDEETPHPHPSPYYPPQVKRRIKSKDKSEQSKCSICLEPFKPSILLLPCSHMCFCDDCYEKVRKRNVKNCPICRESIEEIMFVYPS